MIVDPTASTPTGKIYEHYKDWCGNALKAVSHIKYPKMLSELCNDYLELSGVKWKCSGGRSWFEGLRFRTEGETSPTHSDSLSALIPQNLPTDTGCNTVDTGLGRDSESLPDGNYSHLGGLDAQSFCEMLESSSSSLTEETHITSHQVEIIEKVGLHPTNPVEISEPLPDLDLSQHPNPEKPRELTAERVATGEELVQRLQARILQAIADKNPTAANDVYCQVHQLGVKEAVKALLTDNENENFRRLVKVWKPTKTQP